MTHLRRLLALCLLALACVGAHADPPLPPKPTRWATDRAGYLREATRAQLDAELKAYEQASQHQVILWIGDSLHGVPIEDFAARAMKAWGIGRKKERDGVVLFVFAKDRKLRIEVGYGLEDKLPDAIANRILQENVVPKLKAGDRDGAVEDGVHMILATLGEAADAQPPEAPAPAPAVGTPSSALTSGNTMGCILSLVFVAFWIFIAILIIRAIRRGGGGGGGTTWGGGSSWGSSDSSSTWSSSDSSSDSDFSSGGGDSGGGGASSDW